MDCGPDKKNVSLNLSVALSEIGVNDSTVKMRRKYAMEKEHLFRIQKVLQNGICAFHIFGSYIEGTTTVGLESDLDVLYHQDKNISLVMQEVQEMALCKPDVTKLLVVQDESTSPGYCFLQKIKCDDQRAFDDFTYHKDEKGRILLKNTPIGNRESSEPYFAVFQQHGPALRLSFGDIVYAHHCDDWPEEAREWLNRECIGKWPSVELKQSAVSKGFYLVPVSSKLNNRYEELEWRISTSHAERLMMFDLNIPQIRCYVMLKLLKQKFFTKDGESIISSFMCKCTLFHCIENTPPDYWRDDNLFPCVMKCISELYDRVDKLNCPHYIIPANNLMAGRINPEQRAYLKNILQSIIKHNIDMFFEIEIDNLGSILKMKLTEKNLIYLREVTTNTDVGFYILKHMENQIALQTAYLLILRGQWFKGLQGVFTHVLDELRRLKNLNQTLDDVGVEASIPLTLLLYSIIGSLLASQSVHTNNTVSQIAVWFLRECFESGFSVCGLKLASAYFFSGDIDKAELTLRHIESWNASLLYPVFTCYYRDYSRLRQPFRYNGTPGVCVKFLQCESSIIPQELRQEFFRLFGGRHNRTLFDEWWMDFAVVDHVPYFYFLQYKVYKQLQRIEEGKRALIGLLKIIFHELYLGHKDTALNLLGQCFEQENQPLQALLCYNLSLAIRPNNNAANFLRVYKRL